MVQVVRYDEEKYYIDPSDGKQHRFPSILDPPTLYLSVIVPAKDEQDRLPAMLDECLPYLDNRQKEDSSFTWEIIIVDDGSTDKTTDVAHKYAKEWSQEKMRVLKLKHNRGKGGAVRLGFMVSRGANLLFADADGATTFSDFAQLETELNKLTPESKNAKNNFKSTDEKSVAVGSRAHLAEKAIAERSLFRTILMYGFHLLVWLFCVRTVHDTQCGFKLFTRPAARLLFSNLHIERWAFDVELLFLAEKFDVPIVEVPVNWQEIEGSKIVPVISWLQMGRDLIMVWFRYTFGIWTATAERPKFE